MNTILYEHRTLVCWGITGVVGLLILLLIAQPYLARHAAYDTEIERDSQLVNRLTRIVESKEAINDAFERFDDEGLINLVYPATWSANQVSLDIQKRLTEIVGAHGAGVRTVAPINKKQDGYRVLGVRINFSGQMDQVMGVLQDIEASKPVLIIDDIDIKSMRSRARRGQPVQQSAQVQLEALSYVLEAEGGGQ